jgi:hypothetical protein
MLGCVFLCAFLDGLSVGSIVAIAQFQCTKVKEKATKKNLPKAQKKGAFINYFTWIALIGVMRVTK